MTVKEFLKNVARQQILIERKTVQVQEMESSLIYYGINNTGTGGSSDGQSRSRALANWVGLKDELEKDIEKFVREKEIALRMIDELSNSNMIEVFYMHYLENRKWEDIARSMDFTTVWIWRLHKRGLKELEINHPEFVADVNS